MTRCELLFFSNSASNNLEQVIINLSLCILLANKPVKTTPKHNNQVLFQNHDIMISCVIRPDIIPSSHLGFRNFTIPNVLYIHPTCFSNPLYLLNINLSYCLNNPALYRYLINSSVVKKQ